MSLKIWSVQVGGKWANELFLKEHLLLLNNIIIRLTNKQDPLGDCYVLFVLFSFGRFVFGKMVPWNGKMGSEGSVFVLLGWWWFFFVEKIVKKVFYPCLHVWSLVMVRKNLMTSFQLASGVSTIEKCAYFFLEKAIFLRICSVIYKFIEESSSRKYIFLNLSSIQVGGKLANEFSLK